ncbi:phospho-sugar mutase [Actinobacteria bacterium YIM 96077]|uniref:Phospho-sugar mutase n=1 Tax=Phytoactinopolyspora halophila TaxID=1981511 RepID=A0A329QKD1_9ACTN|nr:phospho-sugar mutase [Phytoactinopolyspora halophila]AYY14416.1 phospho-sugar mutase [Actinobacteria bacterium YIM 96077]RAW11862.1 phospho-sugar mutase [Phytoactinopolyspora halophila]
MNDVLDQARSWLVDDPDPATRAELQALIDRAAAGSPDAFAELGDRFSGFLTFGTAGLRGVLGAGPNRMNRSVVIRAASGLASYLHAMREPVRGEQHRVVVGYDARHGSHTFALDTAAVLTAAGIEAWLMPRQLPTPALAFAIRHLAADAGVMVTASHNPPRDNGYKVYLGGPDGGSQIVAPIDAEIASYIHDVHFTTHVRRATDGWHTVDEETIDAYVTSVARMAANPRSAPDVTGGDTPGVGVAATEPGQDGRRDLRIVLTSLHGVGGELAVDALARAGFGDVHPVPEQADPDPDFPTVAFPNPEEPGALDLAIDLASRVGADLILANDPDADRLAVAVPVAHTPGWQILHGDEVGALLGFHLARSGTDGEHPQRVFVNTIVSSRLLGRIAAAHGIDHVETLTGFKWISRVPGITYGYEEALGYCVDPQSVRDKDGLSAAVLFADLAAATKAAGRTLWDVLDDLARTHGVHATEPLSIRVEDTKHIADAMRRLRRNPPAELAGSPVTARHDLSTGVDGLPPTDGVRYVTADDSRVIVRPSGTEPKVKCYLEAVVPVSDGDLDHARSVAGTRIASMRTDIGAALGL